MKDVSQVLQELDLISNKEDFQAFLLANPEATSAGLLGELSGMAQMGPEYGESVLVVQQLLKESQSDPSAAWDAYQVVLRDRESVGKSGDAFYRSGLADARSGDFESAIPKIEKAIETSLKLGAGIQVSLRRDDLGQMWLARLEGSRAENVENALRLFEAAGIWAPDLEFKARVRTNNAAALHERIYGDPGQNMRWAQLHLGDAQGEASKEDFALREKIENNLSVAFARADYGDASLNRRKALKHANNFLSSQNFTRDPVGWVRAQLILGQATEQLHQVDEAADDPLSFFEAARKGAEEASLSQFSCLALQSLARVKRDRATHETALSEERAELLEGARRDLSEARKTVGQFEHWTLAAEIDLDDGITCIELGRLEEAKQLLGDALEDLPLSASPILRRSAAHELASAQSALGEFHDANTNFKIAIEAAELAFLARIEVVGRDIELAAVRRLYSEASAVFALTGELELATEILETGRTREFRRRLELQEAFIATLPGVPPGEMEQLTSAASELRRSPARKPETDSAEVFQEIFNRVQSKYNLAPIAGQVSIEQIRDVLAENETAVYVNPVSFGLSVVVVSRYQVTTHFSSSPTYEDVQNALKEYLDAASGAGGDTALSGAIERALDWNSKALVPEIREALADERNENLILVPTGLVSMLPIHLSTNEPGLIPPNGTSEIRYAPSISLLSRRRFEPLPKRRRATFIGIGNPTGSNLAASEGEIASASMHFRKTYRHTALQDKATPEFFDKWAPSSNFLHLACHAVGGVSNFDEAGIVLANQELVSANSISTMTLDDSFVVASGCRTGLSPRQPLIDEAYSLAATFLHCGARCVVASLWKTRDLPTLLLMTKFYDLLVSGKRPPLALNKSQQWLRQLTVPNLESFTEEHPEIGDYVPGSSELESDLRDAGNTSGLPFAEPRNWAAFVVYGD